MGGATVGPHGEAASSLRRARVLTVSDSVWAGSREDRSGPALVTLLSAHGFVVDDVEVVQDGVSSVSQALQQLADGFAGLLVTTGGTGFAPSDCTPEATRAILEREAPGLAEAMRAASPLGPLSRAVAGTRGQCLIVNVPGSESGATESLAAIVGLLGHALELLHGKQPH